MVRYHSLCGPAESNVYTTVPDPAYNYCPKQTILTKFQYKYCVNSTEPSYVAA